MAQTSPTPITPGPAQAPQRSNRSTFGTLFDAFVVWILNAVAQFNSLATNVYNNAVDAYNNASAAAGSASAAAISADAAASSANAPVWVSGTSYTQGQCRYSPIDKKTYRRATNGAGTTDPSLDQTNWVLLSTIQTSVLHVREEQASGTNPSLSSTALVGVRRVFNTTKMNTIPGASLSGNQITLPAGTYTAILSAPIMMAASFGGQEMRTKLLLRNVTDSTYAGVGESCSAYDQSADGFQTSMRATAQLTFTISATKTFEVWQGWGGGSSNPTATATHNGTPSGVGSQVEVYSSAIFCKVS